ncbi:MAG: hypothetical protein HQK76_10005 [Desulfobacterales bacterium]|nr:hypothetical protein [Desulfobacterales bacterium]
MHLTVDELLKKRIESFFITEKAVLQYSKEYREIKCLLRRIVFEVVDISEYYPLSNELINLFDAMGEGTIFYNYFYKNIDPSQSGDARFLRAECRDLLNQIEEFDEWRLKNRNIRILK